MTTTNLKGGTIMTKYLAQMEISNNQRRKDQRKDDLLIFGFEHVYFKS